MITLQEVEKELSKYDAPLQAYMTDGVISIGLSLPIFDLTTGMSSTDTNVVFYVDLDLSGCLEEEVADAVTRLLRQEQEYKR